MTVTKRLIRKWILLLAPLFLLTACAGIVIEPTQAIELTATIAIPATSTETPEPTPEPTPTADPLAG